MKVLVVAEIRLYREGAADGLRKLGAIEQVLTAATSAEALVAARRHDTDVVLLDASMPGSIGVVRSMMAARPDLKVVVIGVREDGPEVVECAEVGIAGYVSRDATLDDLGEVLSAALRGEVWCSARVAARLITHIARQAREQPGEAATVGVLLTTREQEILRLIQHGLANKEIASALGIQLSTVKNHVHSLLTKLGASGRNEVMARPVHFSSQPPERTPS